VYIMLGKRPTDIFSASFRAVITMLMLLQVLWLGANRVMRWEILPTGHVMGVGTYPVECVV